MAIAFSCGCGKRFTARDEYAGRRAICPGCRREFIFPVRDNGGRDEPPPGDRSRPDEPEHDETAETPRPFRKDPVVVIGAAIPTLILTVFFGYLAWPHLTAPAKRKPAPKVVNAAEETKASVKPAESRPRDVTAPAPN